MTESVRFPIKKVIFDWVIENSDKNLDTINKNHSNFQKWVSGEINPTIKQIQELSNFTSIPFSYFFLDQPPEEVIPALKFRTIGNDNAKASRGLIETLNLMEYRQSWMKDYLVENGQDSPLKIVNEFSTKNKIAVVAKEVSDCLNIGAVRENKIDDFYKDLKKNISKQGILVMQNGVVGDQTRRRLKVSEFRAFVLIDDVVPLIFINRADSKTANIFSLIHEYMHILIGSSEILNIDEFSKIDKKEEQWINEVTAKVLLPDVVIKKYLDRDDLSKNKVQIITQIAQKMHVSPMVVAIRMRGMNLCSNSDIDVIKKEQLNHLANKSNSSGGNYYSTKKSRLDSNFMYAVMDSRNSGEISMSEAYSLVGVKKVETYNSLMKSFREDNGI